MAKQESSNSQIRQTLYKERISTGTHNYFLEVKVAHNGSKYLVIDQRRKVGSQYEGTKMRIFEDELLEFQRILGKMAHIALNYEMPLTTVSPIRQETSHSADILPKKCGETELYPGFYEKLLTTHNWEEFEQYTYYLLKLLGIQTAYKFLGERQAGKADGFFKFGNLAVLYDCTLDRDNLEEKKREQMTNYCNRLKLGSIELSGNAIEEFHHHHKQVWLITRGKTRTIKLVNDIPIKEVAVTDLMTVYQERLKYPSTNEQLEFKLRTLE